MIDPSLIGTGRLTAHVACYDNGRTPDDGLPPDRVVETEVWLEADGTPITDEARIAAVRAAQQRQERSGEEWGVFPLDHVPETVR